MKKIEWWRLRDCLIYYIRTSSWGYINGRIYKNLNYIDNEVYVGATIQPLSKRMATHWQNVNKPKCQHYPLYTKMKEYGIGNFYIELIETYPCENMEELRKREGHYIGEFGTLNKRIAGRTHQEYDREYYQDNPTRHKEYRQNNRTQILAQHKEYREANRDAISERRKTLYTCACGSTCRIDVKAKHERTKKHQAFITNLDVPTQTES